MPADRLARLVSKQAEIIRRVSTLEHVCKHNKVRLDRLERDLARKKAPDEDSKSR